MIGEILGAVGDFITGSTNAALQYDVANRNLQFQKDTLNYQKQLQREIFQREDNSIQRRAADIAAAGGNPATAWETGQGAGVGQSVPVETPQFDASGIGASLAQIQGGFRQFSQYGINDATIRNLQADIALKNMSLITERLRQLQLKSLTTKSDTEKALIDNKIKTLEYNLDYSIDSNLRTTDNMPTVYNAGKDFFNNVIPSNLNSLSSSDLLGVIAQAGLLFLPGLASLKAVKVGSKLVPSAKAALKYIKQNGLPKSVNDYKAIVKMLTGKYPSQSDVDNYVNDYLKKQYKSPRAYYYKSYRGY